MSVQFGRWSFHTKPLEPNQLKRVDDVLAPYGPDGASSYSQGELQILYRAFYTTPECNRVMQPFVTKSEAIVTWDGRLDNREDLLRSTDSGLATSSPDISIVAAAYEKWGTSCLEKLLGDWAISIFEPVNHSLTLAKDPVGVRHLYYSLENDHVHWCTLLEPLLLLADRVLILSEEYIAAWLTFFPDVHLTPYVGICSVPPSSSVTIQSGMASVKRYWDFDPKRTVRLQSDTEYEEQFRSVFSDAVHRRLRSAGPIVAELSGGMDSTSIVCVADKLLSKAATGRIDTISFYDDSEPNWNERPFFLQVESQRTHPGHHINASPQADYVFGYEETGIPSTPAFHARPTEAAREYALCLRSQESRVVLSGVGGDEVMGGVPTPEAEIQDLLVAGHFALLGKQLKAWALAQRKPLFHLLFFSLPEFFPIPLLAGRQLVVPWLTRQFASRFHEALAGYEYPLKPLGPRPSFQKNISTLDTVRRQLAASALPCEPCYEKRYPYLDRTLLEFIFALPRQQLVRPGERRSLMRRALRGLVPPEVLERKRKGYSARSTAMALYTQWRRAMQPGQILITSALGIVDQAVLSQAVEDLQTGHDVSLIPLLRTLSMEMWLRAVLSPDQSHESDALPSRAAVRTRHAIGFNPRGLNVSQARKDTYHDLQ